MCAFYEDVVRLEAPRREEAFVVFEIRREIRWALDASERTFLEWKSQTLSSQLLAFNEMPIRPSEPRWRIAQYATRGFEHVQLGLLGTEPAQLVKRLVTEIVPRLAEL